MVAEVSFFNTVYFGVRLWLWLYLFFSILMGILVTIFFFREKIKRKYYELRYPEKLIKVIVHYKSGMFKEYWRIIPDDDIIKAENKFYSFSDTQLLTISSKETLATKSDKDDYMNITIDKIKYQLSDKHLLKKRWRYYPEIHYLFNVPAPVVFNVKNKRIELSAKQLEEFNENNLFAKLLNADMEKNMLRILFFVVMGNILGTGFIIAKMMGWIS